MTTQTQHDLAPAIRVPDHLIVGGRQIYSFAEHGLL
ncbi:CP4-57 prophage; putative DNA repair protein [Escherichia coli]|nr:CP4-57 prophage; putative DNA repair protein [Escherichia coli]